MASKVSHILKIIGRKIPDAGAHMYHAATGVSDGGETKGKKRHAMKKAFARQRKMSSKKYDEGTHSYTLDGYMRP
jgi:hypothetical protein